MDFFGIFKVIGEAIGIIKPIVDKKNQAKTATGEAMKDSAASESPSIQIQDEIDWLKDELQKDIDKEKQNKEQKQ